MNKQELELRVKELTAAVTTYNNDTIQLKADLAIAEKQLAFLDRPKITKLQMDDINDAISQVINSVHFSDVGNYDVDFEIDYDNRLALSDIEFNSSDEIADDLSSEIEALFNVIPEEKLS